MTQSLSMEDNLYQERRGTVEWQSVYSVRGDSHSSGLSTMIAQKVETER